MSYIYLSHFLDNATPCYGGKKNIDIRVQSNILKGDSSNSLHLEFHNHVGTHVDFPRHFSNMGKTINDFSSDYWKFEKVVLIEYNACADEIIESSNPVFGNIPNDTELLLIKTSFQKYRNKTLYWSNNPGLSPTIAQILRKKAPKIRAIGFDFISLSSYQNRELGRMAHKSFLVEQEILVFEDVKLDELRLSPISVIALPLMINQVDGVPLSIIADVD